MALRHFHKSWKLFWEIIFSILVIVVVLVGGAFIVLQLDATEDIIAQKVETSFQQNYKGELIIGELDGTLPFNAVFKDVKLVARIDSTHTDTVASVERIEVGIDLWALFQNKLSIDAFSLKRPTVKLIAHGKGSYSFLNALQKEHKKPKGQDTNDPFLSSWMRNMEIMAPNVTISGGTLFIEKFLGETKNINLPEPLMVDSLDTQMYVELTESHRFFDIENFTARINDLQTEFITFRGQIYNDEQVLEFNAFHLTAGNSHLHFNGIIKGINLYAGHIAHQFKNATYDLTISSHQLILAEFAAISPEIPTFKAPLEFTIKVDGALNALQLETFKLGTGDSYFSLGGQLKNLLNTAALSYEFNIDTLEVYRQDLKRFTNQLDASLFQAIKNLKLQGEASGTADSLSLNISGKSTIGQFTFVGYTQLTAPYHYKGQITGGGVDIGPITGASIDTTFLNFKASVEGQNTSLTDGRLAFEGAATNSFINHIPIDSLRFTVLLNEGLLDVKYFYRESDEIIAGEAGASFNKEAPTITLTGKTERLDLATLLVTPPVDSTQLNTSYKVKLQGLKPDRIHGMARFKVAPSIIGGDSVQAHHIEVRLSPPAEDMRTFVVNSSLFDMHISGDLEPTNISHLYTYWSGYFKRRVIREIFLDNITVTSAKDAPSVAPLQIKGRIDVKNLDIVKKYLPSFPSITTDGQIRFVVTASASDLQFSSQVQSDTLIVNQIHFKNAGLNFNGRFRYNKELKQYSNLEFSANVAQLKSDLFNMDSLRMNLRFHEDSLLLAQHVKQFSDSARYNLRLYASLTDSSITTVIDEFFLGNGRYAWQASETPAVTYNRAGAFKFDSFRFQNRSSFIALRGVASMDPSDSLKYIIREVNLGRISSLLREEINFDGILNATLLTRSLRKQPAVQGQLRVNRLTLKNHLVGDTYISSNYNSAKERIDVHLAVKADSSSRVKNSSASQKTEGNIVIDGYYIPTAARIQQDTSIYFKADFNELDMWVLPLILEDIFLKAGGTATGSGYITGNTNNLDFHADFQLHDVFIRPTFLKTDYYLTGEVRLDSQEGVIINYVDVRDDNNYGTGTLWGQVDLNDFKPIKYLDLHLRLKNLKFLSNSYEPGIPFYGKVAGTGNIHLKGATTNMRLFTSEDLILTGLSHFTLPLIERTQLTEADEFIEFVDNFENPEKAIHRDRTQTLKARAEGEQELEEVVSELTFTDKVNIDLQFRAPQPITVTLLFDPVTGEKLRAEGTGHLRIIMQGGDVRMFGRFNVTGGTYNFVSGQIFSRELEILPGGYIVWNGSPEEARLNIKAVYHARPDISSLTLGVSNDGISSSIPVNLIIEITGTLNSIQNNFYFEIPEYITTASPTLQFRINQINSNEEEKLVQATSILLTGEFIAVAPGGSRVGAIGKRFSQSSTFINPLISNQIISPLLSSQINALLNSDVAELDIDFQLNAYNEIDLGVALRLYNDKLILQRQGRLTGGPGTDKFLERLGNLSATYRITPHLSVKAFHRQVPTLGTFSATQAADIQPSVDGIGLEAQVQFNTWQQLWYNITGIFESVLGIDDKDDPENQKGKTQGGETANNKRKQKTDSDQLKLN